MLQDDVEKDERQRGIDGGVIAIDGPAGSGKSTVAREVAGRLGWLYVTTGAMYRAFGWLLLESKRSLDDESAVRAVGSEMSLFFRQDSVSGSVFLGDRDVTMAIRTPQISEQASLVAKNRLVRELLLPLQRRVVLGCRGAVVDGRDMGTVVFPDAPLKVFLDASPEERAKRRAREMEEKGQSINIEEIVREIHERDKRDSERDIAPMRPAEDALYLDSTRLTPEAVVETIVSEAEKRGLMVGGETARARS